MPKVSHAYQENRRNQIIQAAQRCCARKGFHQTTMQDIITESALSPGAIYLYFKSKDEIIQTAVDIRHESEKELFSEIFADESANAALSQIAQHFFSSLQDEDTFKERQMDVQLWGEAMVNPAAFKIVHEGLGETKRAFTEIITRYQDQGRLKREYSPTALAQVMLAIFQGFILQMQLNKDLDVDDFTYIVQGMVDHLTQ